MADASANKASTPVVEANGAHIPLLGLGTWQLRGRACGRIVELALRLGYRHVDTAEIYDNEAAVGEGLRASGVKRADIFVTTKIWPSHYAPGELERAARECLVRLRLSEVDLLLLHWPNPQIPLTETLSALAKVKRDGLTRHIGVSNFNAAQIEEAFRAVSEPLVCNQVECHPFLDQSKLIAACRKHGMAVVAYSPIAQGTAGNDKVLARIGGAHGKKMCIRDTRYSATLSRQTFATSKCRARTNVLLMRRSLPHFGGQIDDKLGRLIEIMERGVCQSSPETR